jgi:hypothetical protein
VWEAVRDVGAVHTRLAPGFVVDTRLEADTRVVTFANGLVARELIVDIDDDARRLVFGGRPCRKPDTMPGMDSVQPFLGWLRAHLFAVVFVASLRPRLARSGL